MTEAKFTKGPWFCEYGTDGYYAIYHNGDEELSSDVPANESLIAAAPDMYEALETAERMMWALGACDTIGHNIIKSALAKARGEK